MMNKKLAASTNKFCMNPQADSSTNFKQDQLPLLRAEIEILASDNSHLKTIAGAAALLISHIDLTSLPRNAVSAAAKLAWHIDKLSDELMAEALQLTKN